MRRACIFVSYWHAPDLPFHIRHHVEALAGLGIEVHFVSNSPLGDESRRTLARSCRSVRVRGNTGFDFAAWRDVIRTFDLENYDRLLLTNSSIIGPLSDLSEVFLEMERRTCDFWGLTVNRFRRFHLQSFFLYFKKPVFRSSAWETFWSGVIDLDDKRQVIRRYEVGLYAHFAAAGFTGTSYIAPAPLWTIVVPALPLWERKKPLYFDDPTMARALAIVREGFPYVKASLLFGKARRPGSTLDDFRRAAPDGYDWDALAEQCRAAAGRS
jgi:lipopolysaccharide biosynthesis protein